MILVDMLFGGIIVGFIVGVLAYDYIAGDRRCEQCVACKSARKHMPCERWEGR